MEKLGSGTFGQVRNVNGMAVKKFKKLRHMIQEVSVVMYMKGSPHIITCIDYNLERLEMTMPLYTDTLRRAIDDYNFSNDELHYIFKSILFGIRDLHSRDILHSDLKPSNILINYNPLRVVICDLGLSAVTKYAKTSQTARGYRLPDDMLSEKNSSSHDNYSLAIMGLELFTGVRLRGDKTPTSLRAAIRESMGNSKLSKCLEGLTYNDKTNKRYLNVFDVSSILYNDTRVTIATPIIETRGVILKETLTKYKSKIKRLAKDHNIERGSIIHQVMVNRITDPSYERVPKEDYNLYVVAFLLIFSSIFCSGSNRFSKEDAKTIINSSNRWNMNDLYKTLYDIMDKENVMKYVLHKSTESEV